MSGFLVLEVSKKIIMFYKLVHGCKFLLLCLLLQLLLSSLLGLFLLPGMCYWSKEEEESESIIQKSTMIYLVHRYNIKFSGVLLENQCKITVLYVYKSSKIILMKIKKDWVWKMGMKINTNSKLKNIILDKLNILMIYQWIILLPLRKNAKMKAVVAKWLSF